jgi:hypothetical protein
MWRNHNTQGYTDSVMAMTVENFLRTADGLGALEFVLSLSIDEKARPAARCRYRRGRFRWREEADGLRHHPG